MPTYEYFCTKCEHQIEVFQSMMEKPLTVCPKEKCAMKTWGKGKIKKQIGAGAGLIFKGSGFYITDYRSKQYKEAAKKESGGSTEGGGGESKGGETKKSGETKSVPAAAPAKTESKPKTEKK